MQVHDWTTRTLLHTFFAKQVLQDILLGRYWQPIKHFQCCISPGSTKTCNFLSKPSVCIIYCQFPLRICYTSFCRARYLSQIEDSIFSTRKSSWDSSCTPCGKKAKKIFCAHVLVLSTAPPWSTFVVGSDWDIFWKLTLTLSVGLNPQVGLNFKLFAPFLSWKSRGRNIIRRRYTHTLYITWSVHFSRTNFITTHEPRWWW